MMSRLDRRILLAEMDGQPLYQVQPIARGVIVDLDCNPWSLLFRSMHEQTVIEHQRRGLHRAANRILTAPLTELASLPLLSNPGRLVLEGRPVAVPVIQQPKSKARAK